MNTLTAKQKIIILGFGWLVLCLSMYSYFFKILDKKNQALAFAIVEENRKLLVLEAEKQSFNQAQADLGLLSKQSISPDSFFSKDISLVREIQELEIQAENAGVTLSINNLSGTVKNASKAKALGDIVYVSATLGVKGGLPEVISYMEYIEQARFVANIPSISFTAADQGRVSAALETQFYLKR